MRNLDSQAIEDIALGAALLGAGGGGDPYVGKLMALQSIKNYGPVTMIDVEEVPDDALVVPTAMMGAPSVLIEKIANGSEFKRAFEAMEKYFGKKIYATMPIEAGGVNSMVPLAVSAQMNVPIIDVDGMGRAFPELQMVTYHLHGITSGPMVVTDEKGNVAILDTISNKWSENIARAMTVAQGGSVMICIYPMTGKQLKQCGIRKIMTYSEEIGKAIRESSKYDIPPIEQLLDKINGYQLFKGKITDVLRETKNGFNFGTVKLSGVAEYKGESCEVNFQNENLVAKKNGEVVATTPDLVCLVDLENITPITTDALKYGRRVLVVGLKCDDQWRTEKGIETVGPKYFGYDIDYIPIEERVRGAE
ncbi:DUF917 domain-containing protein [Clostridium sediminicola]|uniref:DUF917 domain-containing protein n=1 Tax=Clostridium sediminicola TaxID=3114879 RepID=UPI0031F1E5C3